MFGIGRAVSESSRRPCLENKLLLYLKQLYWTWQKKDSAMEGRKTHSLFDNLINTPACNIFFEACQKLLVKESKMSDLSQQNNESTVIPGNKDVYLDLDSDNKSQDRITASVLGKIHSLPPVRKKKILRVRQHLAEGTYDIDKRLNTVLDRLLEKLIG